MRLLFVGLLMAPSLALKGWFLLLILIVCTVLFSCTSGEGDYEPEVGSFGNQPGLVGGEEGHDYEGGGEGFGHEGGGEEGGGEEHGHEGGEGHEEGGAGHGNDPTHIVDGALLCLHKKHIYSSCDESCRLSASGDLHVPPDRVDEFCNGPCLEETNLVLDCLDGIMDHFLFYNRATTQDVRDTVLAGCGHGEHRGDFDVLEHIEYDEGSGRMGTKPTITLLFGIVITILWQILRL